MCNNFESNKISHRSKNYGETMRVIIGLFLMVLSVSASADVPQEIQGIWTPDIEKSIVLMEKNMSEMDSDFIRDKYLPKLKTIITKNQFTRITGGRELKASISLKDNQGGSTFILILSIDSNQDMEVTFIPTDNGDYIMQSPNPADGSGNIVWKKQ